MSDGVPSSRKTRVYIENTSSLGSLFQITPAMLEAAGARRPDVLPRCEVLFGADLQGFAADVADIDALLASMPEKMRSNVMSETARQWYRL